MATMNQGQLVGRRVVSQDGHVLGEVSSLLVDTASWRVVEVSVKLRKEAVAPLRLKKRRFGSQTVRVPAEEISGVGDAVVLRHRRDELALIAGGEPPPAEQEGVLGPEIEGGVLRPPERSSRQAGERRRPGGPGPGGPTPGGASPSSPR
ncbi:MAG TPA: PRC-barrel domain-containing protein [Kofleriaceae bacterium]|nr:PRC-barrel domain-containing protein [Kofleriaceae bacterium]